MGQPFVMSLGNPYTLLAQTGTMAAALAANSVVFAMQAAADAAATPNLPKRATLVIDALRLTYTAIVASASVVVAGRQLNVYRTAPPQTHPTGGTAVTPLPKNTLDVGSDTGLAVAAQVATTGALTITGFTRGTAILGVLDLSTAAAVGSKVEKFWEFAGTAGALELAPGEFLSISNPAAFDLLLTWQLIIELDYHRRDSR